MIYCCKEHVDLALRSGGERQGSAPFLKEISTEEILSTTCEYCQNPAVYIVAN
ncbi:CxxH/CxxC protein [Peribacillus kribbensis]|uniref:CxxH/CxxC protein n=1 Tax=Peribacillus kribbensis TaxID=356658 RepID=UPI0009D7397F|nr:CxxH/CxxC protein [Peribacillus kribbensis]